MTESKRTLSQYGKRKQEERISSKKAIYGLLLKVTLDDVNYVLATKKVRQVEFCKLGKEE